MQQRMHFTSTGEKDELLNVSRTTDYPHEGKNRSLLTTGNNSKHLTCFYVSETALNILYIPTTHLISTTI